MTKNNIATRIISFLKSSELFCFAVLWLIVLVFIGTLAQRDLGLFRAQQIFFSSFVWWWGFIPLPGAYPTMGVVFIGLTLKLVLDSTWKNGKLGVWITHFGGLLLLLGGFLTAAFSTEGSVMIGPGQTANTFTQEHRLELAVTEQTGKENDQVVSFGPVWLTPKSILKTPNLPFEIQVDRFFSNSEPVKKAPGTPAGDSKGFAAIFDLRPAAEPKGEEPSVAGIIFKVNATNPADASINGTYALFEDMPITQTLTTQNRHFTLEIRKARTPFPFSLELVKFEKSFHPGTGMARAYKSTVILKDGNLSQKVIIQMNEPLRYKGYTFFQSSFIERPEGDITVLSAVKNVGWTFPYISSIVMCIGLLIHLLIQTPKLIRKVEPKQ